MNHHEAFQNLALKGRDFVENSTGICL